jgi:hypothetical protein
MKLTINIAWTAPRIFKGVVTSIHDGDTFTAVVDQGLGIWNHGIHKNQDGLNIRLYGVNARELEQDGGIEARDALSGSSSPATRSPSSATSGTSTPVGSTATSSWSAASTWPRSCWPRAGLLARTTARAPSLSRLPQEGCLMTKQHLQETLAQHQRKVHNDLLRETDLALARRLSDTVKDGGDELVAEVRQRMESSRVMVEAYGESLTTHDYVTNTIEYLADVLRERHRS